MPSLLSQIRDARKYPQIPTNVIVNGALAMHLAGLGSLNSVEQLKDSKVLLKFLGASLPSADTLGRVVDLIYPDTIRDVIGGVYGYLKRNKALAPCWHGLMGLAVDGTESHATYRRCCDGCLEREVGKGEEKRIQYYHRNITALLISEKMRIPLDTEPQRPGEDEVAAAIRLLERMLVKYPRAFDVVLADALFARANFINFLIKHNKDVIVVLKGNCPELLKDATNCFANKPPIRMKRNGQKKTEYWDESGFVSGPQINKPMRVIKTEETKAPVCRQLDGKIEVETSNWMWLTTLLPQQANTEAVAALGHSRWCVENEGFNELDTYWRSNHVYKHAPGAILNFWLFTLLAYTIFRAFFLLNLKPAIRHGHTMLHFACQIKAALYACLPVYRGNPP